MAKVSMEDNLAMWEQIALKVKDGPAATANAMAKHIADRTANKTLRRYYHAPHEWYRARPGEPPAYASGRLARSMFVKEATRALRAAAKVGNKAEYSRILEFGCVIRPTNKKKLHWKDTGSPIKGWYHDFLVVPEHPYIEPTTEEAIHDGSLHDAARDEFRKYDP